MELNNKQQNSEVIFFLGAGASVNAGVPHTLEIVDKFINNIINDSTKSDTVKKIIQNLKKWKKEKGEKEEIDVELLLETLERLENRNKDSLLIFYEPNPHNFPDHIDESSIKNDLKEFIKSVGIVKTESIRYFDPFLGFLTDQTPLDIFSVNYDICLEQFCNVYKKEYVDGFDIKWNPKLFEREDIDFKLYKLHGSIIWYRTDTGNYVKIPIKSGKEQTKLITGEKAETLILYPMRKWEYAEPTLELLLILKKKLETAKFVFVVGYSFRDDHIREIFWDVARKNRDLVLILIDPNSYQIYQDRLKNYKIASIKHDFSSDFSSNDFDAYFPSELSGRTVCLPYEFEKIFPRLRNHFLRHLRNGLRMEKEEKQNEIIGEVPSWNRAINALINSNHMEKVEEILSKNNPIELLGINFSESIGWCVRSIINYAAFEQYEKAKVWFERIADIMKNSPYVEDVLKGPTIITIKFKAFESVHTPKILFENLKKTLDEAQMVITFMNKKKIEKVSPFLQSLESLKKYLQPIIEHQEEAIKISSYIELRKKHHPKEIEEFEMENQKYQKEHSNEPNNKLKTIVEDIEKEEIRKIFEIDS